MNPWSYPYGQALRFFNESNESMNPTFNIVAELSFNESSQLKLVNLNLNEWFYWALSCHSNSIFPSFKEPLNCFGWEKTSRACGRRLCSLKRKKREQSFAARWSVLIKIAFFRHFAFFSQHPRASSMQRRRRFVVVLWLSNYHWNILSFLVLPTRKWV